MKAKLLILFWICSIVLAACSKDDPIPNPKPVPPAYGSRTVLVYLAADNSLSRFALTDLEEMKTGVAKLNYTDIHLLVYIDTGRSPRLVELVKKDGEVVEKVVKNYENRNSVGVDETMEVFKDVFTNKDYQTESYGFVYWSHGDGWVPNPIPIKGKAGKDTANPEIKMSTTPLPTLGWVGQDTGNGKNYMNIHDLVKIMEQEAPHFEFLIFDACFMQSIEVAYALRKYTDYYLGSPTEIPGPGARYDILVPAMFAEGDVALKAAEAYYTPYLDNYKAGEGNDNSNWTGGASLGMLKSSELERLADITKQVLSGIADSEEIRSEVYNYDKRRTSSSSAVGYYDMVEMMRLLTDNTRFTAWKQAFDAALPYWKTTPMNYSAFAGMFSMQGTHGVSHYIPYPGNSSVNHYYYNMEWYTAAGLSELGW